MIIIAPDSFKGTLSAAEVCKIVKEEFLKLDKSLDIRCFPIADGGEGTVDALLCNGGEKINIDVLGPLFDKTTAFFGVLPDNTAVIEMAAASGLPLVGSNKNPMLTTTYGTGQLIAAALDKGCRKIILGIGGSATNDGGIGCASALGANFLNKNGKPVSLTGAGLAEIEKIDLTNLDKRLANAEIIVLCDVTSPLYGKNGAAYVFAPQKGATENQVKLLDYGLQKLAKITEQAIGTDYSRLKGAGAAGGLGFGMVSFLGAKLSEGAPTILKTLNFENAVPKAKLVITGEGCFDAQSLLGKAPGYIARLSKPVPVAVIAGKSKVTNLDGTGIRKIYITGHGNRSFEEIVRECKQDLAATSKQLANDFLNGKFE